jgi:hypothetical protein
MKPDLNHPSWRLILGTAGLIIILTMIV